MGSENKESVNEIYEAPVKEEKKKKKKGLLIFLPFFDFPFPFLAPFYYYEQKKLRYVSGIMKKQSLQFEKKMV